MTSSVDGARLLTSLTCGAMLKASPLAFLITSKFWCTVLMAASTVAVLVALFFSADYHPLGPFQLWITYKKYKSFQGNIFGSNGTFDKVNLFSWAEFSNGNSCCISSIDQSHLWHQFQASGAFFRKTKLICTNWNGIPEWNLPVLNFSYHLAKPWTNRGFAFLK